MPIAKVAVAVRNGAPLEFRELDIADPEGDEVLVQTVASGICHTDILLRDSIFGPSLPAVPGHEGAGIVTKVGSNVHNVKVGDRVVLTQGSCGACQTCLQAHPMNCCNYSQYNTSGRRANGKWSFRELAINANFVGQSSFATYILATEKSAVVLPDNFPIELAAPLGCGLVTGASTVLHVLQPPVGSSILVLGAGAVGLSAVMAAKSRHCAQILVVDLHESRRQKALELGATHVLDGRSSDLAGEIQKITKGGADFAVDAVGITPTVQMTLQATRPGAHIVLLGVNGFGSQIPMDLGSIVFNRKVQGAILGDQVPKVTIPELTKLHLDGQFPYDRFVKFYDFENINEAIADSESGKTIKPILTFGKSA